MSDTRSILVALTEHPRFMTLMKYAEDDWAIHFEPDGGFDRWRGTSLDDVLQKWAEDYHA